jgi:hypothetical protein
MALIVGYPGDFFRKLADSDDVVAKWILGKLAGFERGNGHDG